MKPYRGPGLLKYADCESKVSCSTKLADGMHDILNTDKSLLSRVLTSMAMVRAWPRCRLPVTFGGGMTITKFSLDGSCSALKKPESSHHA